MPLRAPQLLATCSAVLPGFSYLAFNAVKQITSVSVSERFISGNIGCVVYLRPTCGTQQSSQSYNKRQVHFNSLQFTVSMKNPIKNNNLAYTISCTLRFFGYNCYEAYKCCL